MSLDETREMFQMLIEIDKVLGSIEVKYNTLQRETPKVNIMLESFTKLERIALRWVTLSRRIAGTEEATQVFQVLSKVLMIMQMAYASGQLLFSGPVGVIYAIPALAMAQMTIMEGY